MHRVLAHPLGPLGQHLKHVLRRQRHDGEDLVDPLVRHLLVEQVAVGADEDLARPLPPQRVSSTASLNRTSPVQTMPPRCAA
jgi:hypothetical protein